ncbi:MAG: molybdopterin-dependent oxidoreductase, partial [Armatimonadetes bacterium]|nr:molybdopterin-dependent oxidoreductase [Anaerolineae bacterium]
FALLGRLTQKRLPLLLGILAGLVIGTILAFMHISLEEAVAAPSPDAPAQIVRIAWILGVMGLWGLALGWVYTDLAGLNTTSTEANSVQQLDRRQFLVRVGGATATLTVLGAGLSLALQPTETEGEAVATIDSSGATVTAEPAPVNVNATLEPAPGTRPEYTPIEDHYRIDISSRPPVLEEATWTLPFTGLVATPTTFTLAQLRDDYEPMDMIVTMGCISNPVGGDLISTTRWTGLSFQALLDVVQPTEEATYLKITSADGFDEYLEIAAIREDPTIILAYNWDGAPLSQKHGFPLRVHVAERFGMKQPKWITAIEAVPAWEEGYWVRRGWSENAVVQTTSVIDTVAVDAVTEVDGAQLLPIGGIAWASRRGISKVEVRIDDGEWQLATLREPLSDRTWVIWRYDWAFTPGMHNFRVRAVDGTGTPQVIENAPVRPDGATGIHTKLERA